MTAFEHTYLWNDIVYRSHVAHKDAHAISKAQQQLQVELTTHYSTIVEIMRLKASSGGMHVAIPVSSTLHRKLTHSIVNQCVKAVFGDQFVGRVQKNMFTHRIKIYW